MKRLKERILPEWMKKDSDMKNLRLKLRNWGNGASQEWYNRREQGSRTRYSLSKVSLSQGETGIGDRKNFLWENHLWPALWSYLGFHMVKFGSAKEEEKGLQASWKRYKSDTGKWYCHFKTINGLIGMLSLAEQRDGGTSGTLMTQ